MPRGSASRGSELWRQNNSETQFVVCINNEDDPASLEVRKIYRIIPDNRAAEHQFIRVIDESGEDYLYPAAYFVYIELPKAVEAVFA
ncbi:MAG: hypothetical protein HC789_17535 [Microcoleus sp. CSU_2_2]|nr:hypothetical protein [Microcoleus sp. SU_5_3]NJS12045.1 hypothetical protein [Microcoleus sp. CSU_2_2]